MRIARQRNCRNSIAKNFGQPGDAMLQVHESEQLFGISDRASGHGSRAGSGVALQIVEQPQSHGMCLE